MKGLFAILTFNLCHGPDTELRVYRSKAAFDNDRENYLMSFPLDNGQLTEFVVVQGFKPVDLNA